MPAGANYPIDTLLIRHEQRTVHDVVRRIDQGSFVMDPDFQRAFIWDDEKQKQAHRVGTDAHPPASVLPRRGHPRAI